jgi:ribosomal protein S18 acetylase RimI-like enzyme
MDKLKKLWNVFSQSGGIAVYKIVKNRLKRQLIKREHVVLKYNKDTVAPAMKAEIIYKPYVVLQDVPKTTKQQLVALSGAANVDEMFAIFEKKAVFWAIYHQQNIIGYWWSITMDDLKQWYIPLKPQDIVFFAAWVTPVWRGQAIAPSVLMAIINQAVSNDVSIYLDVETWNESGISAWKKAGFVKMGIYPPLSDT